MYDVCSWTLVHKMYMRKSWVESFTRVETDFARVKLLTFFWMYTSGHFGSFLKFYYPYYWDSSVFPCLGLLGTYAIHISVSSFTSHILFFTLHRSVIITAHNARCLLCIYSNVKCKSVIQHTMEDAQQCKWHRSYLRHHNVSLYNVTSVLLFRITL